MQEYREYKTLMLILTENCNLNCVYCYEHHKTLADMPFEIAKRAIDEEFRDLNQYEHGEIELFGGEPFLNFPLVKCIYEYVMETYGKENDIIFSTTTNGTLIHGEIQAWLRERKDNFIVTLSLDGTPEMHNANRPFLGGQGSFESIDLDFFRECWPNCCAKMTFSNKNIANFVDGIIYVDQLGFDPLATFASGMDWGGMETKQLMTDQMRKLVEYYVAHPEKKLCQMLNMNLALMFYPVDDDFRYCGAGLRKKCFDIQGNWYPCQGLSPLTVGKEAARQFCNRDFFDFQLSYDNPCRNCRWVRLCRTCYAANYLETGCIEHNCRDMCYINRLCMLACSRIKYERILRTKKLTKDDQLELQAILQIQQNVLEDPMQNVTIS
jgi:uncharacterized protein